MIYQKLLFDYLENNKDNMLKDSIELIKVYSESKDRESCTKALDKAIEIGTKLGLKCEKRAEGEIGVVTIGEGEEILGVLTHVDVVPIGNIESWEFNPYGELTKDALYGRGATDNKGPTVIMLYVMAGIKNLGIKLHKRCQLIIGTREEIKWDDINKYIEQGHKLPSYGFSPDGEFPIINRESGNLEFKISAKENFAYNYDIDIIDLNGGTAINSVPGKAWVKLVGKAPDIKWPKNIKVIPLADGDIIEAKGKEVHSSYPENGENAIVSLCETLSKFKIKNRAYNQIMQFVVDNFSNNYYFGDKLGFVNHGEYINGEQVSLTTAVPSMIRGNQGAELFVNVRLNHGTTKDEIFNVLENIKDKYGLETDILDYLEPLYVSRNHPFMKILQKSYEEVTQKECGFIAVRGTTYAKAFKNTVAFGTVFEGDFDCAHENDEHIPIISFMKSSQIFGLVLLNTLSTKELLDK